VFVGLPLAGALTLTAASFYYRRIYLDFILRCFKAKPLFIVPRSEPLPPDAEEVRFSTTDGLVLNGCYLPRRAEPRKGVILFGVEFGSDCSSCVAYCDFLLENGFDVFTYEPRGQGSSDSMPGYEPLHWVTHHELDDAKAAIAYLKKRPDADPAGIGFFGISKGAGAGLIAAAEDPWIRGCITDGAYATRSILLAYMVRWVPMVSNRYFLQSILPVWFYGLIADAGLARAEQEAGCRYPSLERAVRRIAPRPVMMIHGADDNYITPALARSLYARARAPREFWLVEGAKHNQAIRVAEAEYRRRVLDFFTKHLAGKSTAVPSTTGRLPYPVRIPEREKTRLEEPVADTR
jgi:pimeloyl-ACP methyl ester carboxylesterase